MRFETKAIHAGFDADPTTGAVMPPIYQTSTYKQEAVGKHKGYEYSRTGNPTRTVLEANLAALENAPFGLAFSSGMAAIDMVIRLLQPGDHILASNDVYGGTFRLFDKVYQKYGLAFSYADGADLNAFAAALRPNTRMVWIETPTNPWLSVVDLAGLARVLLDYSLQTNQTRPLLVVDNTFATPYLQQPLALGADLVLHSTTKYLGGHSDVIGGAVVTHHETLHRQLAFLQNAVGAVPGPMDCFLVLRGIKTLAVRMDRHAENALKIAEFLAGRSEVSRLLYPHHPSHPQNSTALRQMRNGGGMVTLVMDGGEKAARRLVESTRIFALAESLGGVESLIEVPSAMTHLSVAGSPLEVPPGLVRLSVGLENADDLLDDLDQALRRV